MARIDNSFGGSGHILPFVGRDGPYDLPTIVFPGSAFAAVIGIQVRPVLQGLVERGQPSKFLCELFGCEPAVLADALQRMDLPPAPDTRWRRGPFHSRWSIADTQRLIVCWMASARVQAIAEEIGRKPAACYAKSRLLGLPKRNSPLVDDLPAAEEVSVASNSLPAPSQAPIQMPAQAPAPTSVQVSFPGPLANWDDLVGVSAEATAELATEAPVVTEEARAPETLQSGRRAKLPFPPECCGFEAPPNHRAFVRFMDKLHGNISFGIRRNLHKNIPPQVRSELVQAIHVDLVEWFLTPAPDQDEVPVSQRIPRWQTYDPKVGASFAQFICLQIRYKVLDYMKGHRRRQANAEVTSSYESPEALEEVLAADSTAVASMTGSSISAEDAVDLQRFASVIDNISQHHSSVPEVRNRAEAAFSTLLRAALTQEDPETTRRFLQMEVIRQPVSPHNVKTWTSKLREAARVFQTRGERITLAHYGVPVAA